MKDERGSFINTRREIADILGIKPENVTPEDLLTYLKSGSGRSISPTDEGIQLGTKIGKVIVPSIKKLVNHDKLPGVY